MKKIDRKYDDARDWACTPEGIAAYRIARIEAQQRANEEGRDVGIELGRSHCFLVYSLQNEENRSGYELTCEVVHPTTKMVTRPKLNT